jgi:hypothetical protein
VLVGVGEEEIDGATLLGDVGAAVLEPVHVLEAEMVVAAVGPGVLELLTPGASEPVTEAVATTTDGVRVRVNVFDGVKEMETVTGGDRVPVAVPVTLLPREPVAE